MLFSAKHHKNISAYAYRKESTRDSFKMCLFYNYKVFLQDHDHNPSCWEEQTWQQNHINQKMAVNKVHRTFNLFLFSVHFTIYGRLLVSQNSKEN